MKRRQFIKTGIITSSLPLAGSLLWANSMNQKTKKGDPFNLLYAPHFGMFTHHSGKDLIDQIKFMYDQGFRSLEDNGMKDRPLSDQERIAKKMNQLDMTMGVFVAHKIYWSKPNLANGDKDLQNEFVDHIRESVEVAKRVNAKWMTVVPGHVDLGLEMGYQTAHVVEALRRASTILEPHGLIMVLEPLNWWTNHAGQFLLSLIHI